MNQPTFSFGLRLRRLLSPVISVAMGILTLIAAVPVILLTPKARRIQDRIVIWWGTLCLRVAGIRPHVKGLENLPSVGALFVFNHSSLLDILAMHAVIPKSFRFGAKTELFRIPIFGHGMRAAGALEIPRQNLSKAIQVYDRAVGRIQSGESFALAPEGTRVGGTGIGPFKTGPFVLAIKSQAPVVPVVIWGARQLMGPKQLFINYTSPVDVYVEILPPISSEGIDLDNRDRLRDQVHAAMVSAFEVGPYTRFSPGRSS